MITLDEKDFLKSLKQTLEAASLEEKINAVLGYVSINCPAEDIEKEKKFVLKQFPSISDGELTWVAYKFLAQKNILAIQKLLESLIDIEEIKTFGQKINKNIN